MLYYALPPDVMNTVMNLSRKNASRTIGFAFTLARKLAYETAIDISIGRDGNIRGVFTPAFENKLSAVNSLLPVNIKTVREYAKNWAAYRFDQISPEFCVPTPRKDSEVEDFFGITKHFDTATLQSIIDCPETYTEYALAIDKILCEVCKTLAAAPSA